MSLFPPVEKNQAEILLEKTSQLGSAVERERLPIQPDYITQSFQAMRENSLDGPQVYAESITKTLKLKILQTGLTRIDAIRAILRRGPDLNRYITPREVLSTEAIGNTEHTFGFFFSPKGVHERKEIFDDNLEWYSGNVHPDFDSAKNLTSARAKRT